VTVSGTGVTASTVSLTSVTSMTATFTISAGAAAGARNVTVTTAGGTTGAVAFTVTGTTDTISPTPGNSGTLTSAGVSATALTLNWTKASDNVSAQSALQYEVRRSTSNNISTVANAEANGIVAKPYTTDIASANVTGLTSSTSYYFTVIVKDAAGNKAVYGVANATTQTMSDLSPPTVTIVVPYDGDIVKGPAVSIFASATDDVAVRSVWFTLDGAPLGATLTSPPYTITWNTTLVPDGPHTLAANAEDTFGRRATPHSIDLRVGNLTTTYAIPAGGGQSFTVNGSSDPESSVAHARIVGDTNSPTGVAIIDYQTGGTGTPALAAEAENNSVLLSQAGAAAIVETRSGMFHVDIGPTINTGVAIANESSSLATINYSLTDAQGTTVKQGTLALSASKQVSGFLNAPPYNAPMGFTGTFSFTSDVPIAVIATRNFTNERNEFLFSTQPVATTVPTVDPLLPMFADGGGWKTRIILTNESSSPMAGNLEFFGQGSPTAAATPLTLTVNGQTGVIFPYSIPPHSMARLDTQGLTSDATTSGSVRITSTVLNPLGTNSPNAFAILSYKTNNVTVTESSVFAVPTGSNFQMFVEAVAGKEKITSGIAVANASATETSVLLELTKLDGTSAGDPQTFSLAGKGQISKFIDEFFPTLPGNFRGILRITSTAPIGVVDLRGRYNSRDEFLVTTMPPVNQSVPVGGAIVFPHLVSGGGYTSQIILFGQPAGSAVGGLSFTSTNGTRIEGAAPTTP